MSCVWHTVGVLIKNRLELLMLYHQLGIPLESEKSAPHSAYPTRNGVHVSGHTCE